MRSRGHRRKTRLTGRNPWLASLMAFAVFLTFSVAPSLNIAMAMDQGAQAGASSVMPHDMSGMEGPCCDDCENDSKSPCENSALCMSACGKLPIQLGAYIKVFSPTPTDVPALAETGSHDGRSQSPPRRPPKLA